MKLSKFVKRAKSESYCVVIHADDSGIWLGTRLALYNATELPYMEGKEQAGAVLDIDSKAWEKMFFDEKYTAHAGADFGMEQRKFLAMVGPLAQADMQKSGILASLTIAQAILESGWGASELATKANALFGIKADARWSGKAYSKDTKECYDGATYTTITALFRAYDSWAESVADHSAFLLANKRYAAVVGERDYKAACKAIKAAGYATDPGYPQKLIGLIEKYGLTVYDGKAEQEDKTSMTERKTRKEIIIAIPNRKAETVVKALDALERKLGARRFRAIFKSITFDNGTEFAAAEGLERSCVNKRLPRTKVYFCHPYSSWERGTNENTNGMIRRRFPKGTNFAAVTNAQIAQAENWINNYPRKILGYKSSEIVFRECLRELGIAA